MYGNTYDIAIIGLGPAGVLFATHLDKRFKVIALDKKMPHSHNEGFHKPCGGLLAPDAQRSLSCFDLTLPKDVLMWLIDKIPDHIEISYGSACTKITREDDGFQITYIKDGKHKTIWARYIIGTDGAGSVVRRTLFKDFKIRTYLSIQQWFEDAHITPHYSCMLDPEITDSYAWGLTKDNNFIFGGAFRAYP